MSQYNYTNCIMQSFHHCLQLEKCAASSATGECGLLCSFLCFDWLLDHCQNTSLVIWSACLSSSFKQMLNFYPNFHVIILLLVLMISRGGKAADLSLWPLFANSSENARMTNSWTDSHLFSCEWSASLTERTNTVTGARLGLRNHMWAGRNV